MKKEASQMKKLEWLALVRRSRVTRRKPLIGLDERLRHLLEGLEDLRATLPKPRTRLPKRVRTRGKREQGQTKKVERLMRSCERPTNRTTADHLTPR